MQGSFQITANLVDVISGVIQPARVSVVDGRIAAIESVDAAQGFLLPGFVDSHVHIESSMLLPAEFARVAVRHGSVATVSDPHEIANVCGLDGIDLMLENASTSPFKFHFGAPSCVPATNFETAGANLDASAVERVLKTPGINHLSEMMNFPGVISGDDEVHRKIEIARALNLPVDGHAPGLQGEMAVRYFAAGISTDHECVTLAEAEQKIALGCRIAIREGSAARNFNALWPLIDRFPDECMFCSDDKHPDDLLDGHINQLVSRAIRNGCDAMNVFRAATRNPVQHYNLDVGLLQVGDPTDFILVRNLEELEVQQTWIDGVCVYGDATDHLPTKHSRPLNHFVAHPISSDSIALPAESLRARVITVEDGQLVTGQCELPVQVRRDLAISNVSNDVLKLVVVNRYADAPPAVAFVQGFGLERGAFASSVAHDSHNVIAVGVDDEDIVNAINSVIASRGGLAVASPDRHDLLPLPIAGLMSDQDCETVANHYEKLGTAARGLGCQLRAPFMTLSFLALPVIPKLKLTDRGLFDVNQFEFVSVFAQ